MTGKIRVLLVDDNPTFSKMASRYLKKIPGVIVIGTAAGGDEALEKARDLRPDIVLIDLSMPGQSGFQIIPRLRGAFGPKGVIALTVLEGDDYRRAALRAGADEFVPKSAMLQQLIPAIEKITAGTAAVQA